MTLSEVFNENIRDLYHAEKQLTKALPKLVKKATNSQLKQSLEMHLHETEDHGKRLEQCAEILGIKASGKVCHGMMGLIDEVNEHVGELKPGPVMDAEIIICAQKAEHYEICAYGTLCSWGELLGHKEVVELLKQSMAQEEEADKKLSQIAKQVVNAEAMGEEITMMLDGKMKTSANARTTPSTASPASRSNGRKSAGKEKAGASR